MEVGYTEKRPRDSHCNPQDHCLPQVADLHKQNSYSKKLMAQLEIRYARFPPGNLKKRGRSSRADNFPRANHWRRALLEDPGEEDEGARPGQAVDGQCWWQGQC